jgi:fused signal recognition particle receptor
MLAAGDTFRAAAIEQLKDLGRAHQIAGHRRRAGFGFGEPCLQCAVGGARGKLDVLLIDTAGRLQNKAELMNELEKIVRVMRKIDARRRMRCCWCSTPRSDKMR